MGSLNRIYSSLLQPNLPCATLSCRRHCPIMLFMSWAVPRSYRKSAVVWCGLYGSVRGGFGAHDFEGRYEVID